MMFGAINLIATDNIQSTRSHSLRKLLDHLNKDEAIHVDRIINKYSDLFRLADKPIGHTNVTAHKIVTADDRFIYTKRYRFPPFHKK